MQASPPHRPPPARAVGCLSRGRCAATSGGLQRLGSDRQSLLGFLVRDLFTLHVPDPLDLHGQPVYTDIPVSAAAIPKLSCRNMYHQLYRGLPGHGEQA
ncbi:hypothetical protein QJQ45_003774 [Haematococcus lacustris]|nr:hypothetical protein QJQ45_003774 [Haematococcus lacustris]